jgi:predicted ATPase
MLRIDSSGPTRCSILQAARLKATSILAVGILDGEPAAYLVPVRAPMKNGRSSRKRFTRLALRNWRNFSQIEVNLQRRGFLVGPNASGKSNFLDAFRFLRDIVSVGGGFQAAINERDGVSRLRCFAARQYSDVVVHVQVGDDSELADWEYELHLTQKRQRPNITVERVIHRGQILLDRPDSGDKSDPERLTQTFLEQVNANKPFRELAEFFGSVHYYHIVPQLVREPDRSVGKTNDPFGGDFLELVARTPEKTRKSKLRRIKAALEVAVPQLADLELGRDDKGTPYLLGKYSHWRPQGAWLTQRHFSDGTLRLMGLLWALLQDAGPLLLEEPELSLHSGVVRFLPQMFARIQRRSGRQLLISTHSSELLRDEGIGLDEVLVLEPGLEGTLVRTAASIPEVRELLEGGLSMADAIIPRTGPERVQQLTLFEM